MIFNKLFFDYGQEYQLKYCENLVQSMPRRLQNCIRMKGKASSIY